MKEDDEKKVRHMWWITLKYFILFYRLEDIYDGRDG